MVRCAMIYRRFSPPNGNKRCCRRTGLRAQWRAKTIQGGDAMPEVYVYAVEGRSAEQKKALMKDITDAVIKNFGAPADAVVVQIVEAKKTDKAKAGVPFSER
jgi:4-oxalocrotonate tautomerase